MFVQEGGDFLQTFIYFNYFSKMKTYHKYLLKTIMVSFSYAKQPALTEYISQFLKFSLEQCSEEKGVTV